jgi:ABC-type dipeptide/oligopeptide/nickel transport system ATPase subunit
MFESTMAQAAHTGCESCLRELDELLAATARGEHPDAGLMARFRPVANLDVGGIFGHLASIHCQPERFLNPAAKLMRVARRQGRLDEFYRLYFRLILDQFALSQENGHLLLPLWDGPAILGSACTDMLALALRESVLPADRLVTIHAGLGGLEGAAQENVIGVVAAMRVMGIRVAAGTLHCPRSEGLLWVAMPLLVAQGRPNAAMFQAAGKLLGQVGLADRKQHLANRLSGGQQQRVAIARALAMSPSLVLADEPTGNLDTHSADDVFAMMREVNVQLQTTFLIVTHDLRLAHRCDRIIELIDGTIVADQPYPP